MKNINVDEEEIVRKWSVNGRSGTVVRQLVKTDRNGTKHWQYHNEPCPRCSGYGESDAWKNTGRYCYQCGGSGFDVPRIRKEYTEAHLKVLEARRAKAHEKKIEKLKQEIQAKNKELFPEDLIYIVLGDTYKIKDEIKSAGGKFNHVHGWFFNTNVEQFKTFPVSIERAFAERVGLPDVNNPIRVEVPNEKKQSKHVGTVGERISINVTYCTTFVFDNAFSYYGNTYIHKFKDEDDNVIVWKTSSRKDLKAGDVVNINAIVKEHSEFRDEKQTFIKNAKLLKD